MVRAILVSKLVTSFDISGCIKESEPRTSRRNAGFQIRIPTILVGVIPLRELRAFV